MEKLLRQLMALDKASARSVDDNGFLRVHRCHITKAQVAPYYGREIPGNEELKLEPNRVYYGYRDPAELAKSVATWNGIPLQYEHHVDTADAPAKETRVGAMATDATWNPPYIDCSLIVYDEEAKRAIESGSHKELSCAYRYVPDFTPGTSPDGHPFDFVMREISGNHVALVEEGRAGHDVVVADAKPKELPMPNTTGINVEALAQALQAAIAALGAPAQAPQAAPAPAEPPVAAKDADKPAKAPAAPMVATEAPAEGAPAPAAAQAPAAPAAPAPEAQAADPIDQIKAIQAKMAPDDALALGTAIQALVKAATGAKPEPAPAEAPAAPAVPPAAEAGEPEEAKDTEAPGEYVDPEADAKADPEQAIESPEAPAEAVPPAEQAPAAEMPAKPAEQAKAPAAPAPAAPAEKEDEEDFEFDEEPEAKLPEAPAAEAPAALEDEDDEDEEEPYEHADAMRELGFDADNAACREIFEAGRAYGTERAHRKVKAAMDQAIKLTRREDKACVIAAREVRHICGDLNPFAFDSAAAIYGHALKSKGIEISEYAPEAYKGMVAMMAADSAAGKPAGIASDSKPDTNETRTIRCLRRIRIED